MASITRLPNIAPLRLCGFPLLLPTFPLPNNYLGTMAFPSDLEIAQKAKLLPIFTIAQRLGIDPEVAEPYGRTKAKLPLTLIDQKKVAKSKLILVTAVSPTPAGEGKTTTSIGLSEGLNKLGKKTVVVLREPSLGPVFGMKGGAAGGG